MTRWDTEEDYENYRQRLGVRAKAFRKMALMHFIGATLMVGAFAFFLFVGVAHRILIANGAFLLAAFYLLHAGYNKWVTAQQMERFE